MINNIDLSKLTPKELRDLSRKIYEQQKKNVKNQVCDSAREVTRRIYCTEEILVQIKRLRFDFLISEAHKLESVSDALYKEHLTYEINYLKEKLDDQ